MMRLALIGRGRWGANIERTLRGFSGLELIILGRDAIVPPDIDGVLIATPSATHEGLALPFIEKGIATFVEKPLTTTVGGAVRIAEAARRSNAYVFVGHVYLYNPAFQAALRVLPQIGVLQRIECEGMNDQPRTDSSVLWDWLPHHLSTAHAVCKTSPKSVRVHASTEQSHTCDSATVEYLFKDVHLTSRISWCSSEKKRIWTFIGDKGSLIFDDAAVQKLILDINGNISHPAYGNELSLENELRAFVGAIKTGSNDTVSLGTGVAIVREIAAAEQSMLQGYEVVDLSL